MSIRTLAFILFLFTCMFSNSIQAGSEEGIEASPSSPPSSPNHHQLSPVAVAAADESVAPTAPKKLPPRNARKIPKHIDERPITLKHKQMLSMHDRNEQEKARFDVKRAKAVRKEKLQKMNRTDPDRYTPYPRKRY